MKYEKTSYPPINIGTSLMLVIFIILCMVIFAVLSLSGALKDASYSEKNAHRTTCYYEACNQAEELLARIDTVLSERTSDDSLIHELQAVDDTVLVTKEGTALTITYTVPVDEDEILEVVLTAASQESPHYLIQAWTKCSAAEWTGTQTLPVLGSDLQ